MKLTTSLKKRITIAVTVLIIFLIIDHLTSFTYYFFTKIPNAEIPQLLSIIPQLAASNPSPIEIPIGKKYSIISINVNTGVNYFFHLPIVLLSWRRVGFEPIFLIVRSTKLILNKFDNKTIKYLNQLQAKIVYVESVPDFEKTTAMIVREMAGVLSDDIINDNDYVITTDADLYPIDYMYYASFNDGSIHVWNAGCCGTFEFENEKFTMFPMGEF